MKKEGILGFCLVLILFLIAPANAEEEFDGLGPGGCSSPEDCMEYCMTHPEEWDACMAFKERMDSPQRRGLEDFIDDPESYMQYCDDPEKMVDKLIEEMKNKDAFGNHCERMEEELAHMEERFGDECERMKEEHNERQPNKEDMLRHCEDLNFFDHIDTENMEPEDRERMEQEQEEERERCKERAEEEFNWMQAKQKEYKEEDYSRCKEQFNEEQERFAQELQECKEGNGLESMREDMLRQGIEICKRYDESGGNFFHAMQAADEGEREVLEEEYRKMKEFEERREEKSDGGFFDKVLSFLGFKKQVERSVEVMLKDVEALHASIGRLSSVASSLEDLEAREALEAEIAELEEQRLKLLKELEDLGHGMERIEDEELGEPNDISGFFAKTANFLRGDKPLFQ